MTPHDWIYVTLRTVGYVCIAVLIGLSACGVYRLIKGPTEDEYDATYKRAQMIAERKRRP